MPQRTVVQTTGLQLSNLAPPLTVEFAKAESLQSITGEFSDDHGTNPNPRAVANGIGQNVNGAQRDAVASNTVGQSVPPDADKFPPSGADFKHASIDALPGGALPLALLGQEKQATHISDVDNTASRHIAQTLAPSPAITIPLPGGPSTTVFEAGLGPRNGEPAGTHPGQPSFPITTRSGAISFSSPDGLQSVSLGGHTLTTAAQTFPDGTTGSLTASYTFNATTGKGTISYSYTLLDNTLGIPSASFAVVVTDRDGHSNPPGNLVISIADDVPVARADTDAMAQGQVTAETGNVLTGVGTTAGPASADVQGADGGVSVVGVAAGNGPGGAAPGTVGVAVAGAHGTLTLLANGSYSYVHTAGGGSDVFTYTIRDADGSLAHATLTISLGDSAPSNIVIPAPGLAETMVFEAGLPVRTIAGIAEPAGSHVGESGFPTTTQTGTIRFTSPGTKAARWSRSEWKIASRTSHGSPHLCCWKHRENAERGLGYGRKDNKILPMSRKIFSR
ncbi:MAG: Ig-like domain-containing protein [Pseudolabrys sp.]